MKVFVGLGNPGAQYARTPHNLGFLALDALAEELGAEWKTEKRFKAMIAKVLWEGETLWLVKPQTYMNLSGESVGPFLKYYGASADELLVLSDDCDLPPGRLRFRPNGSAGGHNGIKSLIAHLGTEAFSRLRLGAGRQTGDPRGLIDYVLHTFSPEEAKGAAETAATAAEAALYWARHGIAAAQNRYNAARPTNP